MTSEEVIETKKIPSIKGFSEILFLKMYFLFLRLIKLLYDKEFIRQTES